jgi:hypothetical protein
LANHSHRNLQYGVNDVILQRFFDMERLLIIICVSGAKDAADSI